MAQRRGSVSSNGSASGTAQRPGGLQRQNSSGSMTERSFRDPSPNRGALSPHHDDPPPVPALPRDYMTSPVPARSNRRPASVEPPERISSPTPRAAGRGVSLDRGPGVMLPKNTPRITSLNSVVEVGRGQARDSVNFSRPMSPHNSPPISPLSDRRVGSSVDPSVTKSPRSAGGRTPGLRDGEAERIQHSMQATADRPVKKKKKLVAKGVAEGSHFAGGSSGGRPIGTALDTTPPRQSPSNSSTPSPGDSRLQASRIDGDARILPKRKKKRNASSANTENQEGSERPRSSYTSDSDTQSERSYSSDRSRVYNTRAAGLLVKQPSIVREEPEAEDQEVQIFPTEKANGQLAQNGSAVGSAITSSQVTAGRQLHSRSASQPIASTETKNASSLGVPAAKSVTGTKKDPSSVGAVRPQSLSPARAAHFSSQPTLETSEGIKHSPPARSVSPAKSALKHSPSPRGPSPVGSVPGTWNRRNGRPLSEASDTTSAISDEGFKGAPKKKKSVRVSFDDDSVVVGRAASPESQNSPVLMSPQNKESSSKWFNKREEGGTSTDSAIQPTPALPSFGSVRERKNERGPDDPGNARINQKQSHSPDRYETSSDLVIGNVLAQHYKEKEQRRSNDPIPPEVTSVEGTGYHSNSEDEVFNDLDAKPQQLEANVALPIADSQSSLAPGPTKDTNQETPPLMSGGLIPSIAVLPATPAVESPRAEQKDWFRIPGEFPLSTDTLVEDSPSTSTVVQHHATDPTPADIGIAEPEPGPAVNHHEAGRSTVGSVADILRTQIHTHSHEESDDTADSIYSDAAEDLSDIEGDGFGSINAIVESPANAKPTAVTKAKSDLSNKEAPNNAKRRPDLRGRGESELSEPASDEGWDRAQAYWSGLSQTRKQQLERAAIPGAVDDVEAETKPKPRTKKKASKKKAPQSPVSDHPPLPPWPDKQYRDDVARPASPKASAMKQSMRSSQPETSTEFHMRSSMRNGAIPKAQRNSVQSSDAPQPRGALQKKSRPVSAVAMIDYNEPGIKSTANHARAASAGIGSVATPVPVSPPASPRGKPTTANLRRIKSNGSDSSSSFRKQRPTADSNRYTMKRSMRAGLTDDQPQSLRGNRTSVYSARSPSPNGSTRRPMSAAGSSMRTSMRGATDSRKQNRTKSPSRFGFGKSSKSKPAAGSRSGFSSRFGDSSDEDIGPTNRRSRFEDSSDDDGPSGLTPVRGIPRRIDEGDSTDLEDSSAEPSPIIPATRHRPSSKAKNQGLTLAGASRNPATSPALVSPGLEGNTANDKEKKKRSFFGGLGGKKREDSFVRSPTRQDTPLERPKATRLNTADSHDPFVSGEVPSPKSPKLQRRNTPKRFASDSWPLPEMPAAKGDSRPNTSDGNRVNAGNGTRNGTGTGASARPELGTRRSTVQNDSAGNGVNGVIVTGKTGKKKRFPLLRKALGLND